MRDEIQHIISEKSLIQFEDDNNLWEKVTLNEFVMLTCFHKIHHNRLLKKQIE